MTTDTIPDLSANTATDPSQLFQTDAELERQKRLKLKAKSIQSEKSESLNQHDKPHSCVQIGSKILAMEIVNGCQDGEDMVVFIGDSGSVARRVEFKVNFKIFPFHFRPLY